MTRTEEHCEQVGLAEALYKLGVCFLQIGYTAQALDHLQQSLALAQELGDSLGQALALAQVKHPDCLSDLTFIRSDLHPPPLRGRLRLPASGAAVCCCTLSRAAVCCCTLSLSSYSGAAARQLL